MKLLEGGDFLNDSPAQEFWTEEELESVTNCPICNGQQRVLIHKGITDKIYFATPGTWNLYQCRQCGGGFLDPRPTPDSIWRAYTAYHTHLSKAGDDGAADPGGWRSMRRALRNGYINRRYGSCLEPTTWLSPIVMPVLPRKRNEIDRSLRNLPPLKNGERKSLLDIGCGSGEYLRAASELGWNVIGLDPDPNAAGLSNGLDVRKGGLPATSLPSEMFDVVTLNHVIEHVHDPVNCLREVFRICKTGGIVWIATPNLASYGHQYFRDNWIGLHPPNHLVLFTHSSIKRALYAAGFEQVSFPGTSPQHDYFEMSWCLEQGEKPFDPRVRRLRLSQQIRGNLAEVKAALNPQHREEIVVMAKKPNR